MEELKTSISLKLDLSSIINIKGYRSQESEYVLKIVAYNGGGWDSHSENIENLPIFAQSSVKVETSGIVQTTLEVPIGSSVIFEAKLVMRNTVTNEESQDALYYGKSDVINIKQTDNKVSIILKKTQLGEDLNISLKNEFLVQFNTLGGSIVDDQKVEKYKTATAPASPTKTGYTFDGWYTSSDEGTTLETEFDFTAPITSDITLYAKWLQLYTITYNLNEGNWADGFTPTEDRNANAKIILPTADHIIRPNFEFDGWYDDDNNKITEIPSDTAQNISVTAKWYNAICDASNVSEKLSALTGDGPYDVVVRGEISSETITKLKNALENVYFTKKVGVNLDLSETTGLDSIGNGAFSNNNGLATIILPNTVTTIGTRAFFRTRLPEITIPDRVTSIGENAFGYCAKLTSVTIPDSVISIGENAFESCTELTSVTIGNSVPSIGSYAFNGCTGLESVTIGNSVSSIGISAFNNCSSLTTVNYRGTEEEWGQITISGGNDNLTNAATKNYNYQGE